LYCSGKIRRLVLFLLLGTLVVAPAAAQRNIPDRLAQLKIVDVKEPDGQILSYRYLGGSSDIEMRGTRLAPNARIRLKVGSRPGFVELDINRGQITGLTPATQFGRDFLTYVLWAVSVDGRASNLGEITFDDDRPISINVTTPYQTFWLMLTAEPDYAVVDPSELVVLYSAARNTGGQADGKADTIKSGLFFYTHYSDYDRGPAKAADGPPELLQARKAVELASKSGILASGQGSSATKEAEQTREALKKAREYLGNAEAAFKANRGGNDVAQQSRTAAQIAENARALALGAVGGVLIRELEDEVEQLRAELARLQAAPVEPPPVEPADVTPQAVPMPEETRTVPEATAGEQVAEMLTKPVTWFGIIGWVVALLLLFRRRSV
jgi:hypothetical protein